MRPDTTTYAVYGESYRGKRTYLGCVDSMREANAMSRQWRDRYPRIIISADTLIDGEFTSIESTDLSINKTRTNP